MCHGATKSHSTVKVQTVIWTLNENHSYNVLWLSVSHTNEEPSKQQAPVLLSNHPDKLWIIALATRTKNKHSSIFPINVQLTFLLHNHESSIVTFTKNTPLSPCSYNCLLLIFLAKKHAGLIARLPHCVVEFLALLLPNWHVYHNWELWHEWS